LSSVSMYIVNVIILPERSIETQKDENFENCFFNQNKLELR